MRFKMIVKFIVIYAVLMFIPRVSGGRSRPEARGRRSMRNAKRSSEPFNSHATRALK